MPRRPEIGNVQLYPNRPLRRSDKNGYVLKFYCPIQRKRIRRNCGTRDRREARSVLRECRERLLNGQYLASAGAITAKLETPVAVRPADLDSPDDGTPRSWQDCCDRYRCHKSKRVRARSLNDAMSRINIAERIFEGEREDRGLPEGLLIREVMTLEMLEYLQDRLLAGDECRYDIRSPNTVNSMMSAVMAFVRHCAKRAWIDSVPAVEKLDVDDVMKGRPVSGEEFERMLKAVPKVVGKESAPSWTFALRILWESAFRIGDLMDFSWDDERHIHPVWSTRKGQHATIIVPPSQKNGRLQQIPLLPGLQEVLESVPKRHRSGWVVNPQPMQYEIKANSSWFRPTDDDLRQLASRYSNCAIAEACHVSDTAVRKWLRGAGIIRNAEFHRHVERISKSEIRTIRKGASRQSSHAAQRLAKRLTKERVGRVISLIGKAAGVIVCKADEESGTRIKYASAHDLRRGCAERLINAGVSAETLKIVMRHRNFATTEKHYGARRSAQAAANEIQRKLKPSDNSTALVGGLMGGIEEAPQLDVEELRKLKALLHSL